MDFQENIFASICWTIVTLMQLRQAKIFLAKYMLQFYGISTSLDALEDISLVWPDPTGSSAHQMQHSTCT